MTIIYFNTVHISLFLVLHTSQQGPHTRRFLPAESFSAISVWQVIWKANASNEDHKMAKTSVQKELICKHTR